MSIDTSRLEKYRSHGADHIARCPACALSGGDTSGDHLIIKADGKFGCVLFQGPDGDSHRSEIFDLVGIKSAPTEKSIWTALPCAPKSAPAPSLTHYELGTPSAQWIYKTNDGDIAGITARYDTAGGKETRPMSWCKDQHGNTAWKWKAQADPRTIYGLPIKGDSVVICEGEKTAEAIRSAGFASTTWQGGCGAVSKSDWSPLAGKRCWIWPDNDLPGAKAKDALVSILAPIAAEIRIVSIPDGMPEGWDAADTTPEEIGRLIHKAIVLETPVDAPSNNPPAFEFVHADDLADTEGAFDFVEDVLSEGAASVIYGASNSGKTFFGLDLAAHVATGREWQGKEVEQGAVIYIALEGHQGAKNRLKAMKLRGILPKGSPFYVCTSPVNLLDPSHPEIMKQLIASVTLAAGMPVRLVIIDTMARAMAGGDENSGEDMGKAVATIDTVKEATGAHVCVIHHCGKDAARGARGHSSLRAAIDTEIEVTSTEGEKYRSATIVKQRDLTTIAPLCFSLDVVEVGTNRRGKPITSCVVKAEDDIMIPARGKGKPGPKAIYTCEMLLELLPQPSFKAWQLAAKEAHAMGQDAFDGYRGKCAHQWEKTRQGGITRTLEPLPL